MRGRGIGVAAVLAALVCVPVGPIGAQVIHEDIVLTASDGASSDLFGMAVAIDGGRIVVGAWGDDDMGLSSGSVYLFDAVTGEQTGKLTAADGAFGDQFGVAVAADDGILTVAAAGDNDMGFGAGSAYLFDLSTGSLLHKLLAQDGAEGDRFGQSIAIDEGVVVVGASESDSNGDSSGAVYLFDVASGVQLRKIVPADGAEGDYFGHSVDLGDGVVVVGAAGADATGTDSGAVYLFDAETGVLLRKLEPDPGTASAAFGYSVAIDAGVVLVGAAVHDNLNGAAYVYDAATGARISTLTPLAPAEGGLFGASVSIEGSFAVVGSNWHNGSGDRSGAAFLFDALTGDQVSTLLPAAGYTDLQYAFAVRLHDGVFVAGAPGASGTAGAAYLTNLASPRITGHPEARIVDEGGAASFGVVVPPTALGVAYQWRRDGVTLVDGPDLTGAMSSTLELTARRETVGFYDCRVTASGGDAVTSDAALLAVRVPADPGCGVSDLVEPWGVLDLADVVAFVEGFTAGCP